ncbi:hypothetical protein EGW08_001348 [Elysia chlorotica]|uniref:Wiskott-Aldrich syndrome protein family member n=1 Tax=Elysia chlorotica TaxID=188477 RepID=A0A433UAL7_ELYCH|nr:hypothetical protein EGW08_001348 [Elysia chlorotica]
MPLADRTVLPSCLGRRAIAEEDRTEENSLVAVSHNAVLGCIIQLASLVRHADDIFCDLAEECQLVFEKSEAIHLKVHGLARRIEQLDFTEVNIPMPLADRTVLPSCLGRRAIAEEDRTEENSLVAVSHNAVLGCIIQLASLVRHADDIFCDLAEECQLVFEKSEAIHLKVHGLARRIEQLDSTEVNIRMPPVREQNRTYSMLNLTAPTSLTPSLSVYSANLNKARAIETRGIHKSGLQK